MSVLRVAFAGPRAAARGLCALGDGRNWIRGCAVAVAMLAVGATAAGRVHPAAIPVWPMWLWVAFLAGAAVGTPAVLAPAGFGRLLQPLTVFHPEWVGGRIEKLTGALAKRPPPWAGAK